MVSVFRIFFVLALFLAGCTSSEELLDEEGEALYTAFPKGNVDTLSQEFKVIQSALDKHFTQLHRNARWNGCVLVAREGVVLYQNCFGVSDVSTGQTLTSESVFQIASLSKTFTAMATLKLWQDGKLRLDQTLQDFFPELPYANVRIHDLLSHRSGLPNYLVATEKAWKDSSGMMSNDDLIRFLAREQPAMLAATGKKFAYNNTNYALLASIIAKVSGKSYARYMKEEIFEPLGMEHTFVFSTESPYPNDILLTTGYLYKGKPDALVPVDGIAGDKNVYSTVGDLLIWERAVTHDYFFSKAVLDTAVSGQSFERPGIKNYGYGWRLLLRKDEPPLVYHNGWWHGYTSAFYRNPHDETIIIALSNIYNRNTYRMQPVWDILYELEGEMDFDQ